MTEPTRPAPDPVPEAPDVLGELRAQGFDVAALTEDQRTLIHGLSVDELALLLDIKARLEDAGDEVHAHSEIAGGALF
ncbi:hypothetical protein GCM10023347_18820 [Streptomyces chumphonensis]|uniref:Uncharacterized protein n=1 Tax=Streptomyces chumphonensis TaxID=1214925 RepID=A0A927EY24_9ACTN|nr:aroma-sacti cluster domain-containing protein [Streptomyces chumphonensis]MBD3931788.1 hypothetical protein [Streptomyces chumphonensis]